MKLLVALGNPDEKYANTRHNAGFMVADFLSKKWGFSFSKETKFKSEASKTIFQGEQVLIIKPQTYMNLSGEAVIAVMNFFKLSNRDLLVIYDDLSLELGKMRFRANGSDGGHNGIKSIMKHINTKDFDRLKFGVGPQPANIPSEHFVLAQFPKEVSECLNNTIEKASDAVECWLQEGIQKAQNKFN